MSSLLQLFRGSRVTWLWATLPTWTTKLVTPASVLAPTQIHPAAFRGWCVVQCTVYGSRHSDSSTTAQTAQGFLLHQVNYIHKSHFMSVLGFCVIWSLFFSSAPCLPEELEVEVSCESDGDAVVSWNTTHGSSNISLAIIAGSPQVLCTTMHSSCHVSGLGCGQTYDISLTASNEQCSLTNLTHARLVTREYFS